MRESNKIMDADYIEINSRKIGSGFPVYIVAELSANHRQQFDEAVKLIEAAKDAGADAVKLQTYTPDTMTIQCDAPQFRISGGTLWDGKTLYDLYGEACTPWEWQPKLKMVAADLRIDLFSTPFDETAVDFLEVMGVPAYKVASFEVVDIPLIEYIASKGKPMIMSIGMANLEEIGDAVQVTRSAGTQIALLKCTSAYPASVKEMNLLAIPHLAERFGVPVGLSDHTLETTLLAAAVALGACIVEKHFTLSRNTSGPDSAFSLEPTEFKEMVATIRSAEKALGKAYYGISETEAKSRIFRRSLFVVRNMKTGDTFTEENVRSIRPGYGLAPKHLRDVLGQQASQDIKRGTPLSWPHVMNR
ncbi:pseudaminic acid synthase [Chloroflexota bacterium]